MYIDISTNRYPLFLENIYADNPNVICPEYLEKYRLVKTTDQPKHDDCLQYCKESKPEEIDGEWFQVWELVDYSETEIEANLKARELSERIANRITVTRRQALLALFLQNELKDSDVLEAINTIEDPSDRYTTRIEWEGAASFDSDSDVVHAVAGILGLSEFDVRRLFEFARGL